MDCPYCIKVCSKCGEILVANEMNFYKKKNGKYGLKATCKVCDKQYQEDNKQHKQEYDKQYYQDNKEQRCNYSREYRKEHKNDKDYKERDKESKEKWLRNNQEKRKEVSKRNRHKRRSQIKGEIYTNEQWQECLKFFDFKCAYSGLDINLSIDHIIPLSEGGNNYIWNLVPMFKNYNSSKNKSNMLEWYMQQDFYSDERLAKIYQWQEYAYNKWGNNNE